MLVTDFVSNDTLRVCCHNKFHVIDEADKIECNIGEMYTCGVCLENIKVEEFKLPCEHTGHASCLSIWFRTNYTCIISRAPVTEVYRKQLLDLCKDTEAHSTSSRAYLRKRTLSSDIHKTFDTASHRKRTKSEDKKQQLYALYLQIWWLARDRSVFTTMLSTWNVIIC